MPHSAHDLTGIHASSASLVSAWAPKKTGPTIRRHAPDGFAPADAPDDCDEVTEPPSPPASGSVGGRAHLLQSLGQNEALLRWTRSASGHYQRGTRRVRADGKQVRTVKERISGAVDAAGCAISKQAVTVGQGLRRGLAGSRTVGYATRGGGAAAAPIVYGAATALSAGGTATVSSTSALPDLALTEVAGPLWGFNLAAQGHARANFKTKSFEAGRQMAERRRMAEDYVRKLGKHLRDPNKPAPSQREADAFLAYRRAVFENHRACRAVLAGMKREKRKSNLGREPVSAHTRAAATERVLAASASQWAEHRDVTLQTPVLIGNNIVRPAAQQLVPAVAAPAFDAIGPLGMAIGGGLDIGEGRLRTRIAKRRRQQINESVATLCRLRESCAADSGTERKLYEHILDAYTFHLAAAHDAAVVEQRCGLGLIATGAGRLTAGAAGLAKAGIGVAAAAGAAGVAMGTVGIGVGVGVGVAATASVGLMTYQAYREHELDHDAKWEEREARALIATRSPAAIIRRVIEGGAEACRIRTGDFVGGDEVYAGGRQREVRAGNVHLAVHAHALRLVDEIAEDDSRGLLGPQTPLMSLLLQLGLDAAAASGHVLGIRTCLDQAPPAREQAIELARDMIGEALRLPMRREPVHPSAFFEAVNKAFAVACPGATPGEVAARPRHSRRRDYNRVLRLLESQVNLNEFSQSMKRLQADREGMAGHADGGGFITALLGLNEHLLQQRLKSG